jgi:hypothetical protein
MAVIVIGHSKKSQGMSFIVFLWLKLQLLS